jgi:hypothetical protein
LLKKNKPIPEKGIEPEHNDRIRTLENEAAAVSCEYKLSDYDLQELIFDKYVQKFPDTYFVDLTKLVRVKVGSNPQNYLIYNTEEEVTDTIKFKKRRFTRKRIGFHPIVTGEPQYDEYGSLQGYEIGTPRTLFDKEFDPEFVKKLISKCRSGPRELLIARGATSGEHPVLDPVRSCFNLDDFLYGEFDLLMEAGRLNYLNSGTGYQEFLKVRAANLEHAAPTITAAKKTHGDQERER